MPKKQTIAKETAVATAPTPSARTAKPTTPRVKAAQHSRNVSIEPAAVPASAENCHDAIARIAYGYWESRGHEGGSALEDWVRAEHEYGQRAAAIRL